MTSPAAGPTRRLPQQGRSRDTIERILRAADVEIGVCGVAGASTTRIARRAGLSVGAIYRFFDDMNAIVEALAGRYLEAVTPAYEDAVSHAQSLGDIEQVLGRVLVRAAALQDQHPGYHRLSEELAPERVDSPAHRVREQLIDLFSKALRSAGVTVADAELRQVVELCIETVRHTLARTPAGHPAREDMLVELERMLGAYLIARLR